MIAPRKSFQNEASVVRDVIYEKAYFAKLILLKIIYVPRLQLYRTTFSQKPGKLNSLYIKISNQHSGKNSSPKEIDYFSISGKNGCWVCQSLSKAYKKSEFF